MHRCKHHNSRYLKKPEHTSRFLTTTQVNASFTNLRSISIFQDLEVRNQSAGLEAGEADASSAIVKDE